MTAERLRARGTSTSDADEAVSRAMASDADPWPAAIHLPTTGIEADSLTRAVAVLAETGLR